jgi:hypothetical protein
MEKKFIHWSLSTVVWIRIRLDLHHLGESGSESASRSCWSEAGSGSVSISTKCKVKLYFFPRKYLIYRTVQNMDNYDAYDADEKDKTKWTGTAVNKIQKFFCFQNMCKTWLKIRIRIWIGITVESRIRIRHQNDVDRRQWLSSMNFLLAPILSFLAWLKCAFLIDVEYFSVAHISSKFLLHFYVPCFCLYQIYVI